MVDFNTTTYQGHGINGIRMIELLLARFIRLRLFPCSVGFIAARSAIHVTRTITTIAPQPLNTRMLFILSRNQDGNSNLLQYNRMTGAYLRTAKILAFLKPPYRV